MLPTLPLMAWRNCSRRAWMQLGTLLAAALLLTPALALAQVPAEALLLVATPQLRDPFFAKSVVLLTRHGRSPPLGVILNHQLPARGKEPGEQAINLGGPVSPERFAYIFRAAETPKSGDKVLKLPEHWYFGIGSRLPEETLSAPGVSGRKVFRGFASWAPGQLEMEISRGDWLIQPFDGQMLLREDGEAMWHEMLARASSRAI